MELQTDIWTCHACGHVSHPAQRKAAAARRAFETALEKCAEAGLVPLLKTDHGSSLVKLDKIHFAKGSIVDMIGQLHP